MNVQGKYISSRFNPYRKGGDKKEPWSVKGIVK
jgi:hypothetical protein